MNTRVIAAAVSVAALAFAFPASADERLARFDGGIGVIPVSSGAGDATPPNANQNGNVNRNIVRGVQPPGQIWVIEDLRADVRTDGRISVDGRGLLLGGGNNVGLNGNASVFASLICATTVPNQFTQHSTTLTGVALQANGDFRIDDMLTPVPFGCDSPVLLIRNAANQTWFAAGIPKH